MHIPFIYDSWASLTLYFLAAFVLIMGIWQFIQIKTGKTEKVRSLVPVGAAALCMGFVGYFIKSQEAFDTIEAAGDISPGLVAGAIGEAPSYVIFGLIILALSFIFRYVNQK